MKGKRTVKVVAAFATTDSDIDVLTMCTAYKDNNDKYTHVFPCACPHQTVRDCDDACPHFIINGNSGIELPEETGDIDITLRCTNTPGQVVDYVGKVHDGVPAKQRKR